MPEVGGEFQFEMMKNQIQVKIYLEMDSSNGCTKMRMYLMPLNCTLLKSLNGKMYIMYTLSQYS